MLLQLGPNLRQPGTSSSPDWQANWWETEEKATSVVYLLVISGSVCEVCVQRTLHPWVRSMPGRATSVSWLCRVWETGRSPPPSWNLSYPVCWPEQERPPSVGPKNESEETSMRLSAQFMHNTHQRNLPNSVYDTDVYLKMCWLNLKWNFLVLSRVRIIWSSPVIVKKIPQIYA